MAFNLKKFKIFVLQHIMSEFYIPTKYEASGIWFSEGKR